MIAKAKKDRELILIRAQNTQNENKAETIEIEVPEEYEGYNKKIVFITNDGTVWDIIQNNEYKITNAITKYKQVDFYIWLTKEVNGESIDFRSKTKTLRFYDNIDASDEITPEEIHGVNTVVNLLEEEIEKVENLNIEATKIGSTTTITITKKDGTTQQTVINDGADGQDGRDGKDGDDYVITQQDYQNIANIVEQEINIPSKTSQLQNDSGFITNAVNNLTNYYLKSETYTQTEVNSLIGAISTMNLQVVQTLPTQDISTTTIYLVPKTTAETNDAYDEYIYVSNNWEHIGSTEVDLTGYATESWVNTQISNFLTETEIQQLINTAVNQKYTKPALGIPKTDLESDVQTSLGKADTAIQEHQDISGKEDKTNKVTSIDNTSTDTQYPSAKCVHDSQATQDDEIEALQTENERLKATLPTTTGEGEDVTLDKTAEMEFKKPPLPRGNSVQDGEPTPDNLVEIYSVGDNVNLFDKTTITENARFTPDGTIYRDTNYFATDYIPVKVNTRYTANSNFLNSYNRICYYDDNKVFISANDGNDINYFITPTGTKFVRFSKANNQLNTFKLVKGINTGEYSAYGTGCFTVKIVNKNLFNPNTALIKKYVMKSSGGIATSPNWSASDFIQVKPDTQYIYSGVTNRLSDVAGTAFYDETKTFISSVSSTTQTFTTPSNAKYVRISVQTETPNEIQLEQSSTATEHVAYQEQTFTFPLGNEKLMLGDYLADDGIHHLRKQIVLNGSENWNYNVQNNVAYLQLQTKVSSRKGLFSNLFSYYNGDWNTAPDNTISEATSSNFIFIKSTVASDNTAWKSWLSTNNVTIEYELVNEEIIPYTAEQQQVYNLIKKALSYEEQTNITSDTIALFDVEAYQSTKLILENLDSRLTLVEG